VTDPYGNPHNEDAPDPPDRSSWDKAQPPPPAEGKVPQSGFGIASLIIGIVAALIVVASTVMSVAHAVGNPDVGRGTGGPDSTMIALACAIITGAFVAVVGVILGVVALCQANRRKGFGIAGAIVNGCVAFGVLAMVILGR
jgi:hypothetical protein